MTELQEQVRTALSEARIMALGAHVLLGFQLRSVFEERFETLPPTLLFLDATAVFLMVGAIAFLVLPGCYHRIVCMGEDTPAVLAVTSAMALTAGIPFMFTLGIDLGIVGFRVAGAISGWFWGLGTALLALLCWYLATFVLRKIRGTDNAAPTLEKPAETPLSTKTDHILTEARLILPGVQALLGFQFAIVGMSAFDKLPQFARQLHLVSLGFVTLSVVLLMTPAAYHRIVERGNETETFYRIASGLIVAGTVPLAFGICGDLFILMLKVGGSLFWAGLVSCAMLLGIYGLWFGWTLWVRKLRNVRVGGG